jgi:hypothetical protein
VYDRDADKLKLHSHLKRSGIVLYCDICNAACFVRCKNQKVHDERGLRSVRGQKVCSRSISMPKPCKLMGFFFLCLIYVLPSRKYKKGGGCSNSLSSVGSKRFKRIPQKCLQPCPELNNAGHSPVNCLSKFDGYVKCYETMWRY